MSLNKKVWRRGSKRAMIAQFANDGKTRRDAFLELRQLTEQGIEPMVFKANVNGTRIPKSLGKQLLELKHEINRVFKLLEVHGEDLDTKTEDEEIGNDDFESPEDDSPEDEEDSPEEISDEDDSDEEETEEDEEAPKVIATGKVKLADAKQKFLAEVRRIRNFCESRALAGETIDHISLRPLVAAAKLIPAGVPNEALLAAMCIHWPDGAKRDAGIPNFDFVAFSKAIMKARGIEQGTYHELFGYALTLAENRVPIMLVGPFGTGKSFIGRQLAEYLELPYGEAPMNPGATRGDLLGRWVGNDKFINAKFETIYRSGGIFNFEEIDASDAGMLILLNNALANEVLSNTTTGEEIPKSENFIAMATGNTWGYGATREYVARERQDAASLDRWRMGRIFIPIDPDVEEAILA